MIDQYQAATQVHKAAKLFRNNARVEVRDACRLGHAYSFIRPFILVHLSIQKHLQFDKRIVDLLLLYFHIVEMVLQL